MLVFYSKNNSQGQETPLLPYLCVFISHCFYTKTAQIKPFPYSLEENQVTLTSRPSFTEGPATREWGPSDLGHISLLKVWLRFCSFQKAEARVHGLWEAMTSWENGSSLRLCFLDKEKGENLTIAGRAEKGNEII